MDDIADEGASRAKLMRRLLLRRLPGSHTDLAAIISTAGVLANVDAPTREADGRAADLDRPLPSMRDPGLQRGSRVHTSSS